MTLLGQALDGPDPDGVVADLPALHDTLDCATSAALAAEDGDRHRAAFALLEASFAAASAFPAGSREAEALSVIFTAIGRTIAAPGVPPAHSAEPEPGD